MPALSWDILLSTAGLAQTPSPETSEVSHGGSPSPVLSPIVFGCETYDHRDTLRTDFDTILAQVLLSCQSLSQPSTIVATSNEISIITISTVQIQLKRGTPHRMGKFICQTYLRPRCTAALFLSSREIRRKASIRWSSTISLENISASSVS